MATQRATGRKSITLKDVVVHMQHMERRLAKRVDTVEKKISLRIDNAEEKLTQRIDDVEVGLTRRIDALDEDLTATIKDTIKIRRHVGMAVPEDA